MHRVAIRLWCVTLLVAALGVVAPLVSAAEWTPPPGWSVTPTQQTYKALVARLGAAVTANKMGLVTRASATNGAAGLGRKIPGNTVVGVYRADFAIRMLEASIPAGIEAPIRFYITENANGTATLSYKLPSAVFAPYGDGGEKLATLARELDAIFARIAADATAP